MEQKIPMSLVTASAAELSNVELTAVDGSEALPTDLKGHVFFVASVGSVDGKGLPRENGTPIFNGNGMVFRFDFDGSGTALFSSRIVKPLCYYADQLTSRLPRLAPFAFHDVGLARMGLLGARNEPNTAFVTMNTPGQPSRLLVTWDAGRPYEIDPSTLRTVTAVGRREEWKPAMGAGTPFPLILTSAHPCFDENTGELFAINYGRSLPNIIRARLLGDGPRENEMALTRQLPPDARAKIESSSRDAAELIETNGRKNSPEVKDALDRVKQALVDTGHDVGALENLLESEGLDKAEAAAMNILGKDFVRLIRWRGEGALEQFNLVLPDNTPVRIQQTMHQMAITRNWVILMDTAFRFDLESLFNTIVPPIPSWERLLRTLLARRQGSQTVLYLLRRDQLVPGAARVVVKKVVFTQESLHFLADYDDTNDLITIYCHHNVATDASEWLRPYDYSSLSGEAPPSYLLGMPAVGQLDTSRLGRHVIDANAGVVSPPAMCYEIEKTIGIGLYAFRSTLSTGRMPERLESIYWSGSGLWNELATRFVDKLYMKHSNAILPFGGPEGLQKLRQKGGLPAYLLRLDCATMSIADSYSFPPGHSMTSLQFVPRQGGNGGPTDGYILATVATPEGSELWIFDASKLGDKPLCRLSNPEQLKFGFPLHSAYLPEVSPRKAKYQVDQSQEIGSLLLDGGMKDILDQAVTDMRNEV